jgi:hypothetical protein
MAVFGNRVGMSRGSVLTTNLSPTAGTTDAPLAISHIVVDPATDVDSTLTTVSTLTRPASAST